MRQFCKQCGASLAAGVKFCTDCGAAVEGLQPLAAEAKSARAVPVSTEVAPRASTLSKRRSILVGGLVAVGSILAGFLVFVAPDAPSSRQTPRPPATTQAPAPPPSKPASSQAASKPAEATPPTRSDQPATVIANRWERYTNTRYGVTIDYPSDLFAIQPPPPDNAGRTFEAASAKARFHIYSHANAFGASIDELQAEDALNIGDDIVTQQKGEDWYLVIGLRNRDPNGERIARRVLLSEGGAMLHRFEIAYPSAIAKAFEPIVARMMQSLKVDPRIFEKAAGETQATPAAPTARNESPPPTPTPSVAKPAIPAAGGRTWQTVDTARLGLRIPGYSGNAGISAEVPAHWVKSDMPEPNVIQFEGPEANNDNEVYVVFRAERRRPGATLASHAKTIKSRLAGGADKFRVLSERTVQIAGRPAILLPMQFAGSDSPALLHEDVAIVDAGEVFHLINFGAPATRYERDKGIFTHVLETLKLASSGPTAGSGDGSWQVVNSIGLGLKAHGAKRTAGVSLQIPSTWTRVALPEPHLLEYKPPSSSGSHAKLRLLVEALRVPANVSLAREAEAIKSTIKPGVENYREQNEADITVAQRSARRLTLTYKSMDEPGLQRQEFLLVRAGETVFKILVDGPEAETAAIQRVFVRIVETLAVAE